MSLSHKQIGNIFSKLGEFLLHDDAHDIGRFDRLHHWQYGFIMALAGEFMKFTDTFVDFVARFSPPPQGQVPEGDGTQLQKAQRYIQKAVAQPKYKQERLP